MEIEKRRGGGEGELGAGWIVTWRDRGSNSMKERFVHLVDLALPEWEAYGSLSI